MVVFNCLLILLAAVSGGLFCGIVTKNIVVWLRKRNISKKSIKGKNENLFVYFLRNGLYPTMPIAKFLISRFKFVSSILSNAVKLIKERNYECSKETLCSFFCGILVLVALFVSLIFRSIIAGLAVVVLLCACLYTAINSAVEKRSLVTRNSIPEVLRSMETCFGAGYTLLQTFEQVAYESKGALNLLFKRATHVMKIGGSIKESLQLIKEESEAPELSFVAVALDVQHQTGGSMKPVIESAKDMVESKLELLRLLNVQTSHAKLSARIVTILPFALIAIFSIISPNFLAPFFSSFLGVVIFLVACVMETAGVIMVRKMLKVEV